MVMKIHPSVSVRDFPVKALKASTQDFIERSCSLSRSTARFTRQSFACCRILAASVGASSLELGFSHVHWYMGVNKRDCVH